MPASQAIPHSGSISPPASSSFILRSLAWKINLKICADLAKFAKTGRLPDATSRQQNSCYGMTPYTRRRQSSQPPQPICQSRSDTFPSLRLPDAPGLRRSPQRAVAGSALHRATPPQWIFEWYELGGASEFKLVMTLAISGTIAGWSVATGNESGSGPESIVTNDAVNRSEPVRLVTETETVGSVENSG